AAPPCDRRRSLHQQLQTTPDSQQPANYRAKLIRAAQIQLGLGRWSGADRPLAELSETSEAQAGAANLARNGDASGFILGRF
ncbi:hypothetical protein GWI33_012078, partial [Rhynchophorus ferrugineus]